jgi:capsular polysaccharide biosynthesis protein
MAAPAAMRHRSGLAGGLAALKRWRWILLAGTLAAGVAGYVTAGGGPPTYESRAVLLVGPISTNLDTLRAAGQLAETYAQIATSGPALAATAQRAGVGSGPLDVRASASPVTRLLNITARASDAQLAARVANANAAELVNLAAQRKPVSPGYLQVISPAAAGDPTTGPGNLTIAVVAALAGLLGTLAVGLALDRSGAAVHDVEDLEQLSGASCVGRVSRSALRGGRGRDPVVERDPGSPAADEYRLLVARLGLSGLHSVLVIGDDEDGATVAANLAAALEASGIRAALLEVDSHVPGPQRNGASGEGGPKARLARAAAKADIVLLHAPSLQQCPAALRWAACADGTLLVVRRDHTSRDDVQLTAEHLGRARASLVGTVLADAR